MVKLFLPPNIQKDDDYIRDIIARMDMDNDGMINYQEFVQIIKVIGAPVYMRQLFFKSDISMNDKNIGPGISPPCCTLSPPSWGSWSTW